MLRAVHYLRRARPCVQPRAAAERVLWRGFAVFPTSADAEWAADEEGGSTSDADGDGSGGGEVPTLEGVTTVHTREDAARVVKILQSLPTSTFVACDTEVANIDVTVQSPVGNGTVICASMFAGPDVDFGNGPRLWIDNMDEAQGTLMEFQEFFQSPERKKVWHNYSFDRAVLYNHGIDCQGLGGDTMHMARTWDSARAKMGGYSLEALTRDIIGRRKVPMKELFAVHKLKKDGTPGKDTFVPPVDELQRAFTWRPRWIAYSVYDAEGTWLLRKQLQERLESRRWVKGRTMYDFYCQYLIPYAQVLSDMERAGIRVDVEHRLPAAQKQAEQDRIDSVAKFLSWAASVWPPAKDMNVGSDAQKAHFLFAPTKRARRRATPASGATNSSTESEWPAERAFKIENTEGIVEPGKKKATKTRDLVLRGCGIPPVAHTVAGWPAVSGAVLQQLAGSPLRNPPKYGPAFQHFHGGDAGKQACEALYALYTVSAVDTMLSNFILPLQEMADANGRVHCSLNLNTETGRLSARRPNLQNQPALEKDRYKIRQAFCSAPGKQLVVADYGQLELRLLAHMAKCKSMISAFAAGGDFHSRTAMGMYKYIADDVANGKVLLESGSGGKTLPLLKDVYASERRKAKVLNFSIAYGKTAVGLSKDWGVSKEEAQATVDKWYEDRPEVREWQERVLDAARADGVTRTLMGRYRDLPGINSRNWTIRGHSERAAINTPIQGGAADVVMMAMLKLAANQRLAALGWTMLLQIHDEVILEGPAESTDEALALVRADMEHPFEQPLLVDLIVDARAAGTWYDAK